MAHIVWSREKFEEEVRKWGKSHPKQFRMESFLTHLGIPIIHSRSHLPYIIKREHIKKGECGSFDKCAGVLSIEDEYPEVIKAFLFKKVAYLLMKDGRCRVYGVPPSFGEWESDFDSVRRALRGKKLSKKEKLSLGNRAKNLIKGGMFILGPTTKKKPWKPGKAKIKVIGTRTGVNARSGKHVMHRVLSSQL